MLADVLVCPTLLSAPDFENLKLPQPYRAVSTVPVTSVCRRNTTSQPPHRRCRDFRSWQSHDHGGTYHWLRLIPNWNLGYMFLYLDCPQEQERQLLEQFSAGYYRTQQGITERLDIIHSAKVIVSFPALQV